MLNRNKLETTNLQEHKKKGRVAYLDMLKCLGMFIVVSGHIHTSYGWFSLPIHSYVIPMFFLLSGMTFRSSKYAKFGDFIKHRMRTLMLPYAMFSVVTWVFWAAYSYITHSNIDSYWMPLLQTLLAQGSGHFLVHNVPLWFVPCLFVIEMIYYWLEKLSNSVKLVSSVVLAVIGVMMIHVWKGAFLLLPWSIESAFASVIFYYIGNVVVSKYGLKGIEDKVLDNKKISIVTILGLTVILIFTSHYNGHISLGSDLLGKTPFLFYFNAFIGIVTIILYAILVCSVDYKSNFAKSVLAFHLWFGRNSFYIMATHVPIKGVIMVGMAMMIGKSIKFVGNDWVCMPIVFIITCAICSLLSVWIARLKKRDEQLMTKIRQTRLNTANGYQ